MGPKGPRQHSVERTLGVAMAWTEMWPQWLQYAGVCKSVCLGVSVCETDTERAHRGDEWREGLGRHELHSRGPWEIAFQLKAGWWGLGSLDYVIVGEMSSGRAFEGGRVCLSRAPPLPVVSWEQIGGRTRFKDNQRP